MSKGSRTDLCGGWPERAIPTATGGGVARGDMGSWVVQNHSLHRDKLKAPG
jgi:hypothetical protein